MSVLLEAFSPSVKYSSTDTKGSAERESGTIGMARDSRLEGNYYSSMPQLIPSLPLTGLSPNTATATAPPRFAHSNSDGVENWIANDKNTSTESPPKVANGEDENKRMEAMHIACKGLLILVKFLGGDYIKVRSILFQI